MDPLLLNTTSACAGEWRVLWLLLQAFAERLPSVRAVGDFAEAAGLMITRAYPNSLSVAHSCRFST
jgi:hypothetical protein